MPWADDNGYMDASEVKVLISKLAGLPEADIPDDHPEVPRPVSPQPVSSRP